MFFSLSDDTHIRPLHRRRVACIGRGGACASAILDCFGPPSAPDTIPLPVPRLRILFLDASGRCKLLRGREWRSSKSQRCHSVSLARAGAGNTIKRCAARLRLCAAAPVIPLACRFPPCSPSPPPTHTHSHTRARPSHFVQAACSRSRGSDRVRSSPTLSRCNARGFVRHPGKPA
jgi:hypothetical protein